MNRYTINTGMTVSDTAVAISPKSVPYCELISFNKATIGRTFSLLTKIMAENKSLYDHIKTKMLAEANTGCDIGTNTFVNICQRLQPSINAASSKSFGIVAIYPAITSVANVKFLRSGAKSAPVGIDQACFDQNLIHRYNRGKCRNKQGRVKNRINGSLAAELEAG